MTTAHLSLIWLTEAPRLEWLWVRVITPWLTAVRGEWRLLVEVDPLAWPDEQRLLKAWYIPVDPSQGLVGDRFPLVRELEAVLLDAGVLGPGAVAAQHEAAEWLRVRNASY